MNYRNILVAFTIVSLLFGCKDKLDLTPKSAIGDNGFYNNSDEVGGAVIAIYDGLQAVPLREFALTEMRSDNSKSKSREGDWAQFESYNVAPTNQAIGLYWAANYNVIFRANVVLANLDAVESASLKSQFEGEARFARALAHFNLVRAYGDVPLIDKVVIQTDEDYFDRDNSSTVLAFIEDDFTAAAALLAPSGDFGRATSGAANALLGKVKLTRGDHAGAKSVLESVISSGTYALQSNYNDVFYNEGNNEIIYAIQYLNDDVNESQDYSYEMTAFGVRAGLNYITDNFKTQLGVNDTFRAPTLISANNERECGKFLTNSTDTRKCGNDWIVIRYADVLLLYAEAILGSAESTADAAAIGAYNEVRARAGQDELQVGPDVLTKEALANERRIELAFENHRFYDLVRFGNASTVLSDFATSVGYIFEPTDLLLPIPQAEINVSSGKLTQNPGY
jgi:starch-binding outer membrane protein, SusD/RagB family